MKMIWHKATSRDNASACDMAINPGYVARVHAYRDTSTQSVIDFAISPDNFIIIEMTPAEVWRHWKLPKMDETTAYQPAAEQY